LVTVIGGARIFAAGVHSITQILTIFLVIVLAIQKYPLTPLKCLFLPATGAVHSRLEGCTYNLPLN